MQKNQRELCQKTTKLKKKSTHSSDFYWHDPTNFLFVKYQPKEKKSVCLLTSIYSSADGDTNNKKKPEILINNQPEVSNSKTNFKVTNLVVPKRRKCHEKCCENKTAYFASPVRKQPVKNVPKTIS